MKRNGKQHPVLVTTSHRGVFFGYAGDLVLKKGALRITNARLCVYWSADVKGFMGLAATGPTKSCKIGPPVPAITLEAVTSIAECSPEAVTAWENAGWAS